MGTDPEIDRLVGELDRAEKHFARTYLEQRGTLTRDGKYPTVDDARAGAIVLFDQEDRELPETIRYRLHAALAIERSVEPS